jgi:hypothetical protein
MAMTGIKVKSKPLDQVRADVPVDEVATGEQVRFNVIIDKATRKAWKTAAAERDTTVADMLRQAMIDYLRK